MRIPLSLYGPIYVIVYLSDVARVGSQYWHHSCPVCDGKTMNMARIGLALLASLALVACSQQPLSIIKSSPGDDIVSTYETLSERLADSGQSEFNLPDLPASASTKPAAWSTEMSYKINAKNKSESVTLKSIYDNELFKIRTSYVENLLSDLRQTPLQVEDLVAGGQSVRGLIADWQREPFRLREGTWNLQMNTDLGGRLPDIEAAFAFSDPYETYPYDSNAFKQSRLFRLGLRDSWQEFDYGFNYWSVGKSFKGFKRVKVGANKIKPDREANELWVSRKFGNLSVRPFVARFEDNLESDVERPRFTDWQVGGSFEYIFWSWPILAYKGTFAKGIRTNSQEPAGYDAYEGSTESVENIIYYSGDIIQDGTILAGFSKDGDALETKTGMYYISGTYYPIKSVGITPDLTYIEERYPDTQTQTLGASLLLNYQPEQSKFNFYGYGEYGMQKNRDWYLDTNYFYTGIGFKRDFGRKSSSGTKRWSLELGYYRYVDKLSPSSSVDDLSFQLNLIIGNPPALLFDDRLLP